MKLKKFGEVEPKEKKVKKEGRGGAFASAGVPLFPVILFWKNRKISFPSRNLLASTKHLVLY